MLQRGVKSHFNDLFAFYKSFNIRDKADLIFVANDFYKKKFATLSKGKVVTAGYFKNNLYPDMMNKFLVFLYPDRTRALVMCL